MVEAFSFLPPFTFFPFFFHSSYSTLLTSSSSPPPFLLHPHFSSSFSSSSSSSSSFFHNFYPHPIYFELTLGSTLIQNSIWASFIKTNTLSTGLLFQPLEELLRTASVASSETMFWDAELCIQEIIFDIV